MDSRYCVLGTQAKGSADKERGNQAAERVMNKAIEEVQNQIDTNPNAFLHEMKQWQESDWRTSKAMKETRRKRRLAYSDAPTYQLLCRKCHCKACLSTDVRLLGISNHIVIADEFKSKWVRVERKGMVSGDYQLNMKKTAKLSCQGCSYDWGCLSYHKPSEREYPVLKLESFVLLDTITNKKRADKVKWNQAPFNVEEITVEELAELGTEPTHAQE